MQWVVLTLGDRPAEVRAALDSVVAQSGDQPRGTLSSAIVLANGCASPDVADMPDVRVTTTDENLGVPGGRHEAIQLSDSDVVGFLDDDAVLSPGASERIFAAFAATPDLGAVALRLVDEDGNTARRHNPRVGYWRLKESSEVTLFLGGACALRREAYDSVGGYFTELFYGHEELELSWRLIDAGWKIKYLDDVRVTHPKTEISRHSDGWRLTGRNRVWIARRTLPWPVGFVHVTTWLVGGMIRAPRGACGRAYLDGWFDGWRGRIDRRPIRWTTVWKLTRLGRPPLI